MCTAHCKRRDVRNDGSVANFPHRQIHMGAADLIRLRLRSVQGARVGILLGSSSVKSRALMERVEPVLLLQSIKGSRLRSAADQAALDPLLLSEFR